MTTKTVRRVAAGALSVLFSSTAAHALDAGALPQGGAVVGGAAAIVQSGQTLTVNQASDRAVIDWRSFDIGSGAQANFNQPGSGSIAVNRVGASANPTLIEGGLHANGQVWILNPNGVLFGKMAHVDAAGIVASTANINPTRFMAGDNRLTFTGSDHGVVANDGSISIAANGLAAFVAPSVRNSGLINARVGKVALAAGTTFTLDLAGDRLVEIGLGAGNAVVDQSGRIVDEGGVVTLTARAAGQAVDSVINMSGVISTASARQVGGQIVLDGDAVNVAGELNATGTSGGRIALTGRTIDVAPGATLSADAGADGDGGSITAMASAIGGYAGGYSARGGALGGAGGRIETSGTSVSVDDAIKVDASAPNGAAGLWLVDPLNVTITSGAGGGLTGSAVTVGAIQTALAGGTSVDITTSQAGTDSGDLTLASSINATSTGNAGLTLEGRHLSATGGSTISIAGGALTLDVNTVNTLANVAAQPTNWIQDADSMVGTVSGGTTINLGAGTYAPNVTIDKSNLTLNGAGVAEIDVDPGTGQVNAINIGANGVTVKGFNILGEITGSYVTYAFGAPISRGVFAQNGATGFTIANNTIKNIRTGILIDGRNGTGDSVTGNTIDNTKSAISVQYTDASGISITGNHQGSFGNEWGENLHLNGFFNGTTIVANPLGDASPAVQTALLAAKAANSGWAVQDQAYATSNRTNVFVATTGADANQGSPKAKLASIQAGIAAVVSGGTVNVDDGTYVITSSVPYLNVNKSLSLIGQSQEFTKIDARAASQYGLRVTADNVSLSNFTLLGAWTPTGNSYGIKVENQFDSAGSIHNLSISNVTSHGARKAQLDMSGVVGATIDHFTADGTSNGTGTGSLAGAGIAISDSANVTITNSRTHDNAYGGLALYETNVTRTQQVTGITADGTNNFTESVPVYAEDTSGAIDFGTLTIGGLPYVVHAPTNPNDVFTFFEGTEQAAIDLAVLKNAATATVEGYAGSGLTGNNLFSVGFSSVTPAQSMSIKAALDAAQAGATVTLKNGTYVVPATLSIGQSLTLKGQGQDNTTIDARGASTYSLRVQADNVTLRDFKLLGSTVSGGYGIKVEPSLLTDPNSRINSFAIDHVTIDGSNKNALDLNGAHIATIDNVIAKNTTNGNGIALIDSTNVTITNSTTTNNAWGGLRIEEKNASFNQQTDAITVVATNTFNEASPVYLEDDSATKDFGANLNIAGFGYMVKSPSNPSDVYTWFQKTQQGAIDLAAVQSLSAATVQSYSGAGSTGDNSFTVGVSTGGQALSIQTAQNAAQANATINVTAGSYAQNVVVATRTNFNFTGATIGSFALQSAAAGSGLSGSLAATAVTLAGAVTLLGNLVLDTSAANGAITTAAIDAAAAGADGLTINAGTGAVSLGDLGSTSRLGATQVSTSATLTGAVYNANSLSFGGNAVLTAASTTFNTTQSNSAAGNITVSGSLLGTTSGGQSAVLTAGRGTGSAGANGDILLQNVGTGAVRLNNLTVSGDDFGAQTVDLAGNFAAILMGNQVFSSHTLNAGGTVSSTVGGNASGPINAVGDVSFAVVGDVTGAIAGTNISVAAGTLTGATVTASSGATINAGTVTASNLTAVNNVTVTAGSVAGSTFNSSQDVNLNATSVDNSSFNAAQNVSLSATTVAASSFTASQTVNVTATTVGTSTLTAPTVTANAATFDANVSASSGASISGGDISGTFTGGSFALAGTGSVNATVSATSVSVQSPQGSVTGSWQNLTTGGGGQIVTSPTTPVIPVTPVAPVTPVTPVTPVAPVSPVTPEVPATPTTPTLPVTPGDTNLAAGPNPNQIVVQNFALPAGTTVTATGEIVLPQGLVIGLLSPGGAGGAPKLIQVQSVQDLGSLLASGYTAIVIDLSGHQKDKKKQVRLSEK